MDTARLEQFMTLFLSHQRRLYQFVYSLLYDSHAAEDVLQETSLLLWQKFGDFRPDSSFFSWASRIAYLQTLKHLRAGRNQVRALDPDVLEMLASVATEDEQWLNARMTALEFCLKQLSPEERNAVRQRFELGVAPAALAQKQNKTIEAVYKAVQRVRRRLVGCMQRRLAAETRQGGPQ